MHMFSMNIPAQIFGMLALTAVVISLQVNNRERLILIQIIGAIMWSVHYALIGAMTGSIVNIIGIARGGVFYEKHERHWAQNQIWLYTFIVAFIITGVVTYKNIYSILPVTGTIIFTLLIWQNDVKNIRFGYIMVAILWLIYNYISGSLFGLLCESLMIVSNIIAIIRFDILGHEKKHVELHD